MKINILITVFSALALMSCSKKWTCKCEPFEQLGQTDDVEYKFSDMNRTDAKEMCEAAKITLDFTGYHYRECKLKPGH